MMTRTTTPAMILFVVMAVVIRGTMRANAVFIISTLLSLRFGVRGRQRRPDPLRRIDRVGHRARSFGGEVLGTAKSGISPPGHEPGMKVGHPAHRRKEINALGAGASTDGGIQTAEKGSEGSPIVRRHVLEVEKVLARLENQGSGASDLGRGVANEPVLVLP